jgi:hypothetical protein
MIDGMLDFAAEAFEAVGEEFDDIVEDTAVLVDDRVDDVYFRDWHEVRRIVVQFIGGFGRLKYSLR